MIEIAVLSRNRGYLEIAVAYRAIETHDDPVIQHVYFRLLIPPTVNVMG